MTEATREMAVEEVPGWLAAGLVRCAGCELRYLEAGQASGFCRACASIHAALAQRQRQALAAVAACRPQQERQSVPLLTFTQRRRWQRRARLALAACCESLQGLPMGLLWAGMAVAAAGVWAAAVYGVHALLRARG